MTKKNTRQNDEGLPVSHICKRTTVSESESTTRFVRKLAPTVDVTFDGSNWPLQKRVTSDVLPTPWEPTTTILASSEDIVDDVEGGGTVVGVEAKNEAVGEGDRRPKKGGVPTIDKIGERKRTKIRRK